jgi:AsmA family protein
VTTALAEPTEATERVMPKSPRKRGPVVIKRIAAAIGVLVVVVVFTIALAPSSFWRWLIVHEASLATGRTASIDGDVKLHLFSLNPELIVEGFAIGNAPWAQSKNLVSIKRFDATLSLKSLLGLHLIFPRVVLDTPTMDLERDASGRANWDPPSTGKRKTNQGSSAPLHLPVIQELSLTNGSLTARDLVRKLTFDGQVAVEETQNTADNHALRVRGTGTLNGKPFSLHLNGEPLIGVQPSKPYGFDATVTAADIKLTTHATIAHPFDLAALQAVFHLSGSDLADVFYLTGLALPNTPAYDVSGTLVRDNLEFRIDDFQGKLGSSDVAGKLSIDTAPARPKLNATLLSKQLNLADLAAPLGTQATPARKSNTISHSAPAPAEPPSTLLLPDADLQVQRVRGMDADVQFDAASVMTSQIPMKKVHFHLNLDNGKLTLNPLSFDLLQGELSGTVAIDAQGATPRTNIDMKLSQVDLSQFKPKSAQQPPLEGRLLGRIKLQGTGTSVHKTAGNAEGDITFVIPQGKMREAFAELTGIDLSRGLGLILTKNQRNTDVRCGVASFKADDGDLKATTLLIDTTHVLVTGQGDINLRTEALDLSLRGQPKEARLLRLRTPITLRGSLLQPKIGVQAGKLAAQTGGAIALGVLLTPVAAVLAFVDGGLAKDANCAALIGQAEQGKSIPRDR